MDTAGTESRDGEPLDRDTLAGLVAHTPEREGDQSRYPLLHGSQYPDFHKHLHDNLDNDDYSFHHHHGPVNDYIICAAGHDKHNTAGFVIEYDNAALVVHYGPADHTHD
jgi:hypothetical protein